MIQDFFDTTIRVDRLTVINDEFDVPTKKKDFTVHIASLLCMIQPLDNQITKDISTGYGKEVKVFCPVSDIIEGDRIIWDGNEYRVTGVKQFSRYGSSENRHLDVTMRAFKS